MVILIFYLNIVECFNVCDIRYSSTMCYKHALIENLNYNNLKTKYLWDFP